MLVNNTHSFVHTHIYIHTHTHIFIQAYAVEMSSIVIHTLLIEERYEVRRKYSEIDSSRNSSVRNNQAAPLFKADSPHSFVSSPPLRPIPHSFVSCFPHHSLQLRARGIDMFRRLRSYLVASGGVGGTCCRICAGSSRFGGST